MGRDKDTTKLPALSPAEAQVERCFRTYAVHDDQKQRVAQVTAGFADMGRIIAGLVPPGREQSLALTHLEQAMFFANAGIARPKP